MANASEKRPAYRVGADIGGTFTDLVVLGRNGKLFTKKVSSTVGAYESAIVDGLAELFQETGLAAEDIAEVRHATTVASNAILEKAGVRTGLIATAGFRDILEIRNLRMPRLYDLHWEKPAPLIERRLRRVVKERVNFRGAIEIPLDGEEVAREVDFLVSEGVAAIAVCLINAYANDRHEKAIREIIHSRAPEMPVSISSEVLPEINEYHRTSTTVINSYIQPIVDAYLGSLQSRLRESAFSCPLLLMQSNGGLIPAAAAQEKPVHIIESGPAGGVVGAQALSQKLNYPDIITFDMGGTTAKASLIEDGHYTRSLDFQVGAGILMGSRLLTGGGYLLKVPAIDLAEVGAGGGSIVWIDTGGALQIGPKSAGADPGPVCYGLGGREPTVTDANVVLGYLNQQSLVGGALPISAAASKKAIEKEIAEKMSLGVAEAAYGAHQIAASNMIRAIRAISSERGRDPRDYALFAFGGNGPLFAAGMAQALGMSTIIVPPSPGLFSSFGLLYADVEHYYSQSVMSVLRDTPPARLTEVWAVLEKQARTQLQQDGFSHAQIEIKRTANMHYKGQIFELSVEVPPGDFSPSTLGDLEERFGEEHERTYGHRAGVDEPVVLVTAQLVGRGTPDSPAIPGTLQSSQAVQPESEEMRQAYFGPAHGWCETAIIADRRHLAAIPRKGPLIVEEYDATSVVPPDATIETDTDGNMIIRL